MPKGTRISLLDRRAVLKGAAGVALGVLGSLPACGPHSGETRLTLWTLALRPWFDGYMHERLAAFEALHPGVRVDWVDVPFDALERKLIAAASAGRAHDVVNMSDLNFARFAALGAFRAIDDDLGGVSADQTYLASALALCQLPDGGGGRRLMGLPWYVTPQVSIVNTALLREGGLTPETLDPTWTGLLAQAGEFHRRTGKYLFSQPLGEESQIPIMMLGEGVVPVEAKGEGEPFHQPPPSGRGSKGIEASLTRPEVVAFVRAWVEAFRAGHLPRAAGTTGHAHLTQMYQDGSVAAISTGPSFLSRIEKSAPEVYRATTVLPGTTGRLGRAHMPVMVLAVGSQTKHPALAAALAWFLTSAPSQTAFCKLAPIMPSSVGSLDDPFFKPRDEVGGGTLIDQARAISAASLPTATAFTAALDTWPDLRRAFEDGMKRVLLDEADLDRTLASVNAEWDLILSSGAPAGMEAIPRPSAVERFEVVR